MLARDPRKTGRRLSLEEIAAKAGMSKGAVVRLSKKRSWDNVPVLTVQKFMDACGIDPLHPRRKLWYLRRILNHPNGHRILGGQEQPTKTMEIFKSIT